jgi:hypothetical protein
VKSQNRDGTAHLHLRVQAMRSSNSHLLVLFAKGPRDSEFAAKEQAASAGV